MPRSSLALAACAAVTVACGDAGADGTVDVVYDPCAVVVETRRSSSSQELGVSRALELWNRVAGLRLTPSGAKDLPRLVLQFDEAASIFHGVYDDERGLIFINDDLEGDALMITAAHELGHAFGLGHVAARSRRSVMNPNNLTVSPTSEDVANLRARWGTCEVLERLPGESGSGGDELEPSIP